MSRRPLRTALAVALAAGCLSFGSGRGASAAPEPASWALMIAGFGLVGAGLRRQRTATA